MPEPMYKTLVGKLQFPEAMLARRQQEIINSLAGLYPSEVAPDSNGRIYAPDHVAIGRAFNLASSIVLSATNLREVLSGINQDHFLAGNDPLSVMVAAYLYHIITAPQEIVGPAAEKLQDQLRRIRSTCDDFQWILPEQAMRHLGIEKLVQKIP